MSVAPDLLLRPAPEVKPRASVANAPAKAPEPKRDEPSSFAQVYAKEQRTSAKERSDGPERGKSDKADKSEREESPSDASAAAAAVQPALADSGKPLPTEPALDELLLMGMGLQAPVDPEAPAVELTDDAAAQAAAAAALLSVATPITPITLTELQGSTEPLPAIALATAPALPQSSPTVQAAQTTLNAGQTFASALTAAAQPTEQAASTEPEVELALSEVVVEGMESLEGLETPKDSAVDNNRIGTLSQAMTQQTTPAQRVALVPGLPVQMQQGAWSEAVVDKVMWLSSQNLKSAEIQLDPAELGRLEVRIAVNQDQTQVSFVSPHAQVRDALEGQMYRLRELFAQQGMNQLDVSVSDQSANRGGQGQGEGGESDERRGRDGGTGGTDEPVVLGTTELRSPGPGAGRSLVDYYA